jgi:hypothetical protein
MQEVLKEVVKVEKKKVIEFWRKPEM